jgi:hypothetical protein
VSEKTVSCLRVLTWSDNSFSSASSSQSPTFPNNPFNDPYAPNPESTPAMQNQGLVGTASAFSRSQSDHSGSEASGIARGEVGGGYGPYAVSLSIMNKTRSAKKRS